MKRTVTATFDGADPAPRSQYGAVCWRMHRGHVQVLLITSRDTGRWVIPKGWPIDGLDPAASAAREAWEEAGVKGDPVATALGLYAYDKMLSPDRALPCAVVVYPLRVVELAAKFPERKERRRKWFDAAKASRKVAEPELRGLLASLAADPDQLAAPAPATVSPPDPAA